MYCQSTDWIWIVSLQCFLFQSTVQRRIQRPCWEQITFLDTWLKRGLKGHQAWLHFVQHNKVQPCVNYCWANYEWFMAGFSLECNVFFSVKSTLWSTLLFIGAPSIKLNRRRDDFICTFCICIHSNIKVVMLKNVHPSATSKLSITNLTGSAVFQNT